MIGIGVNILPFISKVARAAADYYNRVIAGGGVSESLDCVNTEMSNINGINLLDQASLVMIPSGYKEDVVYSQIPTNGNGDLTWTRASDAWRTNADGLIQRVPWNLLGYSETFDNAIWTKTNTTVVANATNSPNNTLTADELFFTASGGFHLIDQSVSLTSGTTYTQSYFVKDNGQNFVQIYTAGVMGTTDYVNFNLTNGSISDSLGITGEIVNYGNGWYRISATKTPSSTGSGLLPISGIPTATSGRRPSYTGSGQSIFIWGAQLNIGSTAKPYFPTTDRLNVPRLSYMYGSCPALLLEPQRTNLILNSGWVGGGSVPTSWSSFLTGSTTAVTSIKNLSVTAYRFSGTSQRAMFIQTIAVTNAISYASSIYVESVTTSTTIGQMFLVDGSGTSTYYRNNVLANANDTIVAGFTYTLIFVASSTANAGFRFGLGCSSNTTADYILSMPQVEVGAYPTTFILTPTSASATRIADSFSRNNIYTNGLITSSGGTWFVELRGNLAYTRDGGSTSLAISTTSADVFAGSTGIEILANTGLNRLSVIKRISGTATTLYLTTTDTVKIAVKWNGTSADVFVNGTKQVSATSFTTTNMEFLKAFGADVPKFIQAMALYPSPLSDTDCTIITSL